MGGKLEITRKPTSSRSTFEKAVPEQSAGKPSLQKQDLFNKEITLRPGEEVDTSNAIMHRTQTDLVDFRKKVERDDIKQKKNF